MTIGTFKLGDKWIEDADNPRPEEIDTLYMFTRLCDMRRFSEHPKAMNVVDHMNLVHDIAEFNDEPKLVLGWALCHDMHEYATGDIPAPIKRLLGKNIYKMERAWDRAICGALGIPEPTEKTRHAVKQYDRMAASYEWYKFLGGEQHTGFPTVFDAKFPPGYELC